MVPISLPLTMSVMTFFCSPFATKVVIPMSASFCAIFAFVSIPPRPNEDFDGSRHCSNSVSPSTSEITFLQPLSKIPSTFESKMSPSMSNIDAISPASSSLSVNMSSVTEITSFSFTIGMTPFAKSASKQFFMLR